MKYGWGLDTKTLASQFRAFLEDPRTTGGGYRATTGDSYFSYQIGKYVVKGEFLDEDRCKVTVVNGKSIEDTLEVCYIHATEPDFLKLFTETCTLAKKLADGK